MSDNHGDNDKVGYKRPPKHTQFKKGQSGNPGGVNGGAKRGQMAE